MLLVGAALRFVGSLSDCGLLREAPLFTRICPSIIYVCVDDILSIVHIVITSAQGLAITPGNVARTPYVPATYDTLYLVNVERFLRVVHVLHFHPPYVYVYDMTRL